MANTNYHDVHSKFFFVAPLAEFIHAISALSLAAAAATTKLFYEKKKLISLIHVLMKFLLYAVSSIIYGLYVNKINVTPAGGTECPDIIVSHCAWFP